MKISYFDCFIAGRGGDLNRLKPSGFFTYHQGLTFKNSTWCSLCVECFVRISEQTATFVLNIINCIVFITVVESVYCAVRTDSLYKEITFRLYYFSTKPHLSNIRTQDITSIHYRTFGTFSL